MINHSPIRPHPDSKLPEAPLADITSERDVQVGVALMVTAMLMLPGIDAIAKYLSSEMSPGQISWGRFFFQSIFLFPLAAITAGFGVGRNLWKHVTRGVLIALATLLFFAAVSHMPLADTMAIFFVEPLILTLLAPVFLKERVGWRRVTAVIAGLAGSLIIIQPSFLAFGAVALLPLGAATAFAFYIILTRTLTRDTGVFTMQFYVGVFGCLALSIALWFGDRGAIDVLDPVWPTASQWIWLAGLAGFATTGHLLIVQAVRRIGASMIAPFQYIEIVSATGLGYLVFGDFPGPSVWLGIAIIVSAGLYVFYREQRLSRSQGTA